MRLKIFFRTSFLMILLTGCNTASVILNPEFNQNQVYKLAIIATDVAPEMDREHLKSLEQLLESELVPNT
jgi:hypothetical protein